MLASDDEAQWDALQKQFPGTPEATEAAAKLAAAQTVCGDLDRYWAAYDLLAKDTDAALDRRMTGLARLPIKFPDDRRAQGEEQDRIFDQLDKDASDLQTRAEKTATQMHSHRFAKGEETAKKELEKLFTGLTNTYKALADQVDTVTTRSVVNKRISDWESLWKMNGDVIYKPAREKVLAACKK